jgi:predicted transcriptional regulator
MENLTAFRLNKSTMRKLTRLAKATNRNRSWLLRELIEQASELPQQTRAQLFVNAIAETSDAARVAMQRAEASNETS